MLRVGVCVIGFVVSLTAGGLGPIAAGAAQLDPADPDPAPVCCKVCRKGKPCGDTCIARDKACTAAPGCACSADDADE